MDLSEFKPPVRLSMSDEEIYQALGAAQANEDGLARAMAIVEEQANLREHDNQLFSEWVARMQSSDAPEAKIALENVERAKQGLDPLPLVAAPAPATELPEVAIPVDDIVAALNAAHVANEVREDLPPSIFAELQEHSEPENPEAIEVADEPVIDEVIEPVATPAEEEVDEFDQLLAEAAGEATTSIMVSGSAEQPAVTFEVEPELEPVVVPEFAISADEDALVEEESHQASVKVSSGWWANASFTVLATGVFVPAVAAFLTAAAGFTFGTAIAGFGLGLLVNLGLFIAAHFTSQRTEESNLVASRASFGVIGTAIPGIAIIGFAVSAFILALIGGTATFNGAFDLGVSFGSEAFGGVSYTTVIELSLLVVAFVLAGFMPKAIRWFNVVGASLLIGAFIVGGLVTRSQISFEALSFTINFEQVLVIAALVSLAGVGLYGKSPKVIGHASMRGTTIARWFSVAFASVVLPAAVFAHFNLIYSQNAPANGFALLDPLGFAQQTQLTSPILWVVAISFVALLVNLARVAIEALRGFTINLVHGWFTLPLLVVVGALVWFAPAWSTWLELAQLLIVPMAAAAGFGVADSILRRGKYHEASLLRGYGFYGRFNILAVFGFLLATALGFAMSQPLSIAPWLGFADLTTVFAPLSSFAFAIIWVAASGVPRILAQQREVAEVEQRKASLSDFSGFAE